MNQKTIKALVCFLGILMIFSTVQMASAAKIENIYSGTGGDVTKNYLIKKYIPKTTLTNQVVSAAKKGTPMVTFGDGSGPKVLVVAGVHGNELPASIAAMKLINYLNGKKIKGTIYVIPFVVPSSTSKTSRYWKGKNPNSIAHISGTPTNRVLQVAKQKGVKSVGDFHSTRPGGVPGRNSVLCTKYPTYKSYTMAKYISQQTGSKLISDYKAGAKYPGALEDVCNLARIPSVTCEVKSSHGKVASGTVEKSFRQMLAYLKYNGAI